MRWGGTGESEAVEGSRRLLRRVLWRGLPAGILKKGREGYWGIRGREKCPGVGVSEVGSGGEEGREEAVYEGN